MRRRLCDSRDFFLYMTHLTCIYTCQELGSFQTAGYIGPLKIYAADVQGTVTADFVLGRARTVSGSLFWSGGLLQALLYLVLGPKQAASFGPTLLILVLYRRTKASSLIWS